MEKIIKTSLKNRITSHGDFWRIVSKLSRQNKIPTPPTSELLKIFRKLSLPHLSSPSREGEVWRGLEKILCKRPVRTLSGVAIITVLTKPFKCPGKCIYCPSEAGMPKSYLSNEPAAARAKSNNFSPYNQVEMRLETLKSNGHSTDKIELIVKGGSWNAYPQKYREWFITECFRACNLASRGNPKHEIRNPKQPPHSPPISPGAKQGELEGVLQREQKRNEKAKHRIIGLTLETRPDMISEKEILHLRKIGCTRVELGVQTIYDDILKKCRRGHSVKKTIRATKLLKDAGFKVDYHLMPGLPGSSFQKDIKMFEEIFENPDFVPDQIKIYPCTVIPGTELYNLWKHGKFKPLGDKQLVKMLVAVKSNIIPRFCRIARLIRDIPSQSIAAGNKITNLREYIQKEMGKRGLKCKCLRCREIGHQRFAQTEKQRNAETEKLTPRASSRAESRDLIMVPKLFIEKYPASGGMEYFLSLEDKKREAVYAFLRLRFPQGSAGACPPLTGAALVRELHTYGHLATLGTQKQKNKEIPKSRPCVGAGTPAEGLGAKKQNEVQHTGFGKKLMEAAEKIVKNYNLRNLRGSAHPRNPLIKKMAVISGIGVREYYKKLGYRLEGSYMTKKLSNQKL